MLMPIALVNVNELVVVAFKAGAATEALGGTKTPRNDRREGY